MSSFWVVDSVMAARGGEWKKYAVAWSRSIISAILTAEYETSVDGKDYIVLDDTGAAVA